MVDNTKSHFQTCSCCGKPTLRPYLVKYKNSDNRYVIYSCDNCDAKPPVRSKAEKDG